MTTTENFAEATHHNQETLVHLWTDGVRKFWGLPTDTRDTKDVKVPSVPSAEEMVDKAFNFYEKVLTTQREYVKIWLVVGKSMASNYAWMAQNAAKDPAKNPAKDATSHRS